MREIPVTDKRILETRRSLPQSTEGNGRTTSRIPFLVSAYNGVSQRALTALREHNAFLVHDTTHVCHVRPNVARARPSNVSSAIATAPRPIDELTAREREVLALVAQGLTDRGISERLWLAPKTVETHIRHILWKLNLPAGHRHN